MNDYPFRVARRFQRAGSLGVAVAFGIVTLGGVGAAHAADRMVLCEEFTNQY